MRLFVKVKKDEPAVYSRTRTSAVAPELHICSLRLMHVRRFAVNVFEHAQASTSTVRVAASSSKAVRYQDLPQFDDWFAQAGDDDVYEDDPWIDLPLEEDGPRSIESTMVTESSGRVVEYSEDAASMAMSGLQQIALLLRTSSLSEARASVLLEELRCPAASKTLSETFHPMYELYRQELRG